MNPYITNYGDPVITPKGNFVTVSGVQEMNQRLKNLFTTQKGSDLLLPDYGVDMYGITNFVNGPGKDRVFHTLISESIDPDYINQASSINQISTSITGTTGIVSVNITDVDGNNYDTSIEVVNR